MGVYETELKGCLTVQDARARARRLMVMANELLALARDLEAPREPEKPGARIFETGRMASAEDHPVLSEMARRTYESRKRRQEFFDGELFGEPAWDILLDLFIAAREGKKISITSACIASGVPSTTALRWIALLERKGLVLREDDSGDARRVNVRLSADTYLRMASYFRRDMEGQLDRDG